MKLPPQGFFYFFHGFGSFDRDLEGLAMNEKQFCIVWLEKKQEVKVI